MGGKWEIGDGLEDNWYIGDAPGYQNQSYSSGCPICGRMMCDHSPQERGQTTEGMMEQYRREVGQTEKSQDKKRPKKDKKK